MPGRPGEASENSVMSVRTSIGRDDLAGQIRRSKDIFERTSDIGGFANMTHRNAVGNCSQPIRACVAQHVSHNHSGRDNVHSDTAVCELNCQSASMFVAKDRF